MDDPVVQELAHAVSAHGHAVLENPAQVEQLLAGVAASFPGKVKALLILLDKKAVAFLLAWSKETRPDKGGYDQVRQQVCTKFEQAKVLNAAAAGWALDAWAEALGLRRPGATAAAPAPASSGLSLIEPTLPPQAPAPAPPPPTSPRPSAPVPGPGAAVPRTPSPAPVEEPATEVGFSGFVAGGRSVGAGRGWGWIADGWLLFKQSWLIWIVNFILFAVIVVAIQIVPLLGGIAGSVLAAMLTGGIMIGADAVRRGEPLEVGHLFAGFRERAGPLAMLGVLYLLGMLAIVIVAMMLMGVSVVGLATGHSGASMTGLLLGALVALALMVPLFMAYWFAPALVALNDYGPVDAMKESFAACLRNVVPFLVYGLIGLGLCILASIPLGLGWFVLAPVGMASMYASYRDVFFDE